MLSLLLRGRDIRSAHRPKIKVRTYKRFKIDGISKPEQTSDAGEAWSRKGRITY